MVVLSFVAGVIVGAAAAATYWATKYWEVCRELEGRREDATAILRSNECIRSDSLKLKVRNACLDSENNRLKEILDQTQKMLMDRNRVIDGVRDSLATEGDDEC